MATRHLSQIELAARWNISHRTLERWRTTGEGPRFIRLIGRIVYGLHGREMLGWITHLQHTRAKDVFFVGILDAKLDDFNRPIYVPQIDGAKIR
jgi:hypothetical protein